MFKQALCRHRQGAICVLGEKMNGFILVGQVARAYSNSYDKADGSSVTEYVVIINYMGGKITTKGDDVVYTDGEMVACKLAMEVGRGKDGKEFLTWRREQRLTSEQLADLIPLRGEK
jgi:hypothetical protein